MSYLSELEKQFKTTQQNLKNDYNTAKKDSQADFNVAQTRLKKQASDGITQASQNAQNDALMRGFARSTVPGDAITEATGRINEGLNTEISSLSNTLNRELGSLRSTLNRNLADSQSRYEAAVAAEKRRIAAAAAARRAAAQAAQRQQAAADAMKGQNFRNDPAFQAMMKSLGFNPDGTPIGKGGAAPTGGTGGDALDNYMNSPDFKKYWAGMGLDDNGRPLPTTRSPARDAYNSAERSAARSAKSMSTVPYTSRAPGTGGAKNSYAAKAPAQPKKSWLDDVLGAYSSGFDYIFGR
jgi:hypothetical protein